MNSIQAKNRILALHKEGQDGYDRVTLEEYKQLYYAILPTLSSKDQGWRIAVGEFLLHGTMAYDRFVGLRPAFVDEGRYDMYCRFLSTLQRLDGKHTERTYFFHLEKIKWDLFRECNLFPCDEEMNQFLDTCITEIEALTLPQGEERVVENLRHKKEELFAMINNIKTGQVKTLIHTTLPTKLTDTDATINLQVEGVDVHVKLSHHSQGSTIPGTSIAEGSTMTTSGPSRWTTTTCEIDIEADCLMDGLEHRSSVTLQKKEDKRYWTAAFDFTYKVLSAIWMYIQQHEEMMGVWPPLPNDIQYIDYRVIAGGVEIDREMTTNPALVYKVYSLKKEPKHYDVAADDVPGWSSYAYRFAKVYAESGQLKEAIFWLNVSVEALVEEFIQKTITSTEAKAEVEGVEYKFDTAEEILAEQFPEMKGKVKWPQVAIPTTSVFTKLKRALTIIGKGALKKDVQKKYSLIHSKRNALFHGDSIEITVEDIEKAFGAYGWLRENLKE